MALTISSYRQPGVSDTISVIPTVATASGIPIVAVAGQALRGVYSPKLFTNSSDATAMYGPASKANPLSLGIQFAFLNGAANVIGLNVQPDNSIPGSVTIPLNSFPSTAYAGAPTNAIDAITQQPVNTTGNVAATFYIQDFNPLISDPAYGTDAQSVQLAYAFAGQTSMLQYERLLGSTIVPLANTAQQQIVVYSVPQSPSPVNTVTQAQWNQFQNANAILNGLNGAFLSPVLAEILVPNTGSTGYNPIPGYTELYGSIGSTLTPPSGTATVINTFNDAISYASNHGGVLYVSSLTAGTGHQIIMGLFDSNSATTTSQGVPQALGLSLAENTGTSNPFLVFNSGSDGVITTNSYINALTQLENVRADMVVVLNPNPAVQQALKLHVTTMSNQQNRNERLGLTSGPVSESPSTTISNVSALQGGPGAQRMVYAWPPAAFYFDALLNTTVAVDGTYICCALAGILAGGDAATPLTRKILAGFTDVSLHLGNTAANAIAQYGVCIIENDPKYGLRVRDGLTCDPTSPETQEISVVRQIDYSIQILREAMDANIIATKITRNTLAVVTTLAQNALQNLEDTDIIYGYKNIAARINPQEPRQIDLAAQIRPDYPAKYVNIALTVSSSLTGLS